MKIHPTRMKWIVKRLSLIVGAVAMLLLVVAAVQYRKKSVVDDDGLTITIIKNEAENKFIRERDVEEILFREFRHAIVGQPLELVDIEEVEKVLEADIFIKNADVYVDAMNKVHIRIEQRVPIARIMDEEDPSFFSQDATGNFAEIAVHKYGYPMSDVTIKTEKEKGMITPDRAAI